MKRPIAILVACAIVVAACTGSNEVAEVTELPKFVASATSMVPPDAAARMSEEELQKVADLIARGVAVWSSSDSLVYARIADRTVADAYDKVTNQIDALYNRPPGLRTNSTGSVGMAQLATEYDQTMLGNGWCNRPAALDCQFESICETCAFYATDETFNPVLQAQRDHAADRDQHHKDPAPHQNRFRLPRT